MLDVERVYEAELVVHHGFAVVAPHVVIAIFAQAAHVRIPIGVQVVHIADDGGAVFTVAFEDFCDRGVRLLWDIVHYTELSVSIEESVDPSDLRKSISSRETSMTKVSLIHLDNAVKSEIWRDHLVIVVCTSLAD